MNNNDSTVDMKDVIIRLRQRGARFWIRDSRIRIGAPKGVLSEEVLRTFSERSGELWALKRDADAASWDLWSAGLHFQDAMVNLAVIRDGGEDDAPERAAERQRLVAQLDAAHEREADADARLAEDERVFGSVDGGREWFDEPNVAPSEVEVAVDGGIREINTN